MSTNVNSVTKHFPSAQNGFTTTLSSTILSGATTVPLNSVAGYTNGQVAVMIVEPTSSTAKQTFTGVVDTAGVQLTSVVWTAGTNQTHNSGVTVVDYETATHFSMIAKGLLVEHNQDGTHHNVTATSVTATTGTFTNLSITGTAATAGWSALGDVPDTVTFNGNRSYDLVFNGNDLTDTVTNGMRLQLTRTVAPPYRCTSLNGSSQFFNKTSPNKSTFVDDFSASAWIKVNSYVAGTIISRYNGTSGWTLELTATGQVTMAGFNGGAGNESHSLSTQSVPLNKWVHIAAQLDMSTFTAAPTTSYIMIDGLDVPTTVARNGSNPTALIQAGNLEVGSRNAGTQPFPGKLAQVAFFTAKVTQATMKSYMSQGLAGTETSLGSAYSFDNSINDLNTTTPNNLTAQSSAVATNADSPFVQAVTSGTLEYGIIMASSFSTNTTLTVQVPEGSMIPTSGGVSTVLYSLYEVPYAWPGQKGKWRLQTIWRTTLTQTPANNTWISMGVSINIPTGEWIKGYDAQGQGGLGGAGTFDAMITLATSTSAETDSRMTSQAIYSGSNATTTGQGAGSTVHRDGDTSLASITLHTFLMKTTLSGSSVVTNGGSGDCIIFAENAYA